MPFASIQYSVFSKLFITYLLPPKHNPALSTLYLGSNPTLLWSNVPGNSQWAKNGKIVQLTNVGLGGCVILPQRQTSTFFEIYSSLCAGSFGVTLLEKISKNVCDSLWGKYCGFPKLRFFRTLVHCAIACFSNILR